MENVIHTTTCGMFRVIEENGKFFPQERTAKVAGFGRLRNAQEVQRFQAGALNNRVQISSWEGWHLGYTQRNENKGFKSYKSAPAAIKYVDACSLELQA